MTFDQLNAMSNEELRRLFNESRARTVEEFREQAKIVRIWDERKVDMSDLPPKMLDFLRKIAHDQMLPELLDLFAGVPNRLTTLSALAMPDQAHLAAGKGVEVAIRRGGSFDKRIMSPIVMNSDQFKRVFAGNRIHSFAEQVVQLEAAPPEPPPAITPRPAGKVEADPATDTLKVGRAAVPIRDVLKAVGDLAPADAAAAGPGKSVKIDADLFDRLNRLAADGNTTVTHLVRLAILRTYFAE